jgi:hypothetical protein
VLALAVVLGLLVGQHDPVRVLGAPTTLVTPSGSVAVTPYAVACRAGDKSCYLPEIEPAPRWYRPPHLVVVRRGSVIRITTPVNAFDTTLWVEHARCGFARWPTASAHALRLSLGAVRPGLYIARFAFSFRRGGLRVWQTGHFGLQVSSIGRSGTLPMDRCRETTP